MLFSQSEFVLKDFKPFFCHLGPIPQCDHSERGPLIVAWQSLCKGVSTLVNCILCARPYGYCNVLSSAISWTYWSSGLSLLLGKVTRQDMVVPHIFPGLQRNQTGSTARHSKARFLGGLGWSKYLKLRFISQTVNFSLPFSGQPWNWAKLFF